jgi:hypothetical protein
MLPLGNQLNKQQFNIFEKCPYFDFDLTKGVKMDLIKKKECLEGVIF